METRSLVAPRELAGLRLDVALTRLAPDLSRSRVRQLLDDGRVRVDGRAAKPASRLRGGERVELTVPDPPPTEVVAQDLPLTVLHEDRELIVLDKAPGMVVHPARGSPDSTVVNALLHRLASGLGGGDEGDVERMPAAERAPSRLGLVHRLDKDTSGCLVVAKTQRALDVLQAAFRARAVEKTYLALCHGVLAPTGTLDTAYGRHPRDRKRFTGRVEGARRAVTSWQVREAFAGATLAEVTLHTGRTHQIRVHLSEHGHPLLADATYGGTRREARLPPDDPVRRAAAAVGRQALHAWRLAFRHPRSGQRVSFEAPVPRDFQAALRILRGAPAAELRPDRRRV